LRGALHVESAAQEGHISAPMHPSVLPHTLEETRGLGSFLAQLQREISMRDVQSGLWFTKVLTAYVAFYEANRRPDNLVANMSEQEREAAARALTGRTALFTAMAGAGAAAGVTGASIATAQTSGWAAPVVLPLAGAGMVGELLLRSIMHLRLACELAELYGMRFAPGGETELIRLYALAFRAEMHQTEHDPGRGLVQRVLRLQEADGLGKLIASGLVGETLLRNVVPFADVVVSSVRNWQLTKQLGRFVRGYVSRRVVLDQAVEAVRQRSPNSVDLLLEGIWFIFIGDGRLTGIETALLAHLLRRQPGRDELTAHFVSDEVGWLERLRQMDGDTSARALLLRALQVAAVIEAPVSPPEAAILQHAADALGVEAPDLNEAMQMLSAAHQPGASDHPIH
jgi:hypothetical protein